MPRLSLQTGATARGRIETTKVEVERGVVKVDRRLRTGEPHVWAIDPGFRINLHLKDLKNALEAGRESGVVLPVTAEVEQLIAGRASGWSRRLRPFGPHHRP